MKAKRGHIFVVGYEGEHRVIESMGYQPSRDAFAKLVKLDGKQTVVVARTLRGPWTVNRPEILLGGRSRGVGQ